MDTNPRHGRRPGAKRDNGDALVMKTGKSNYSEDFKAIKVMPSLWILEPLVRSIGRNRTGELIFELKRGKTRKGAFYKCLTERFLAKVVSKVHR